MTPIELRLRRFLLVVAALICLGTPVELWLSDKNHAESAVQWIPYLLCALGLLALLAALRHPGRRSLLALRLVATLLIAGSLLGMWEHVEHNLAFELDIRPNATAVEVLPVALRGASPLLAPGVLALAGTLALGATLAHPLLEPRKE